MVYFCRLGLRMLVEPSGRRLRASKFAEMGEEVAVTDFSVLAFKTRPDQHHFDRPFRDQFGVVSAGCEVETIAAMRTLGISKAVGHPDVTVV
jgi:hypothetical protein